MNIYPANTYPDEAGGTYREGAWLEDGHVVLSGDCCVRARPAMKHTAFCSCPVALTRTPDIAHILSGYRAFEKGQLSMVEPHPSAAFLEGVQTVVAEVNALDRRQWEDSKGGD